MAWDDKNSQTLAKTFRLPRSMWNDLEEWVFLHNKVHEKGETENELMVADLVRMALALFLETREPQEEI